jgi:hypothetical protein
VTELLERQNKATGAFVDMIASGLGNGRAVDSATAIVCSARVAGNLLFQSFGFDTKFDTKVMIPGTVILSEEANEQGPELINILVAYLQRHQVPFDEAKLSQQNVKPEELILTMSETLDVFQKTALNIAKENNLNFKEAAQSAALATAFIVRECARTIGAEIGFKIASYGFVEGSKTVPVPMIEIQAKSKIKPWYKFW